MRMIDLQELKGVFVEYIKSLCVYLLTTLLKKVGTEPFMAPDAVVFMEGYLKEIDNAHILEFGSGASTVWFARRTTNLYSVEDNKKWHQNVTKALKSYQGCNEATVYLRDTPYYDICDEFDIESFDLIIVDGRNRKGCFSHALKLLKPGGVIVLDDAQREYYHGVFSLVDDWKTKEAIQKNVRNTRWWVKPK